MCPEQSCPGWGSTFCPDWLPADLRKSKFFVRIGNRPFLLLTGVLPPCERSLFIILQLAPLAYPCRQCHTALARGRLERAFAPMGFVSNILGSCFEPKA
ncbi:uncharacterized protein LACBIDRAFT_304124 [Laccaria bicolor S238N-H82]|uniref:Predicted protein n=1 Tax=Laccaria bicolor (strain S238N-H82 / ATCC MYA-4686) TaxID=486041 RepID=B0DL02_LACBS|nr:uncharacterized protein LACBIDRAFT_304124 [Laccaria bicolor S238N-H82]EDR04738.1 predicted protein [Laccaria bicolor S238N-H82]|eukprot:XP_001884562.1 predicted protein [Laccaria bicolor S238N-H82]